MNMHVRLAFGAAVIIGCGTPGDHSGSADAKREPAVHDEAGSKAKTELADSLERVAIPLLKDKLDTPHVIALFRSAAAIHLDPAIHQPVRALRCWTAICALTNQSIYSDTALAYALKADSLIRYLRIELDDTTSTYVFRWIAFALSESHRIELAQPYALKALDCAIRTGREDDIDRSRDVLASVQQRSGQSQAAIQTARLYVASIQQRWRAGSLDSTDALYYLDQAHTTMGDCFNQLGELDSSIAHARIAYDLIKRLYPLPTVDWSIAEIDLMNCFISRGDAGSALRYAELVERSMPADNPMYGDYMGRALAFEAYAYVASGNIGEAKRVIDRAPRPWLKAGAGRIDWNSAAAPDITELDTWSCVLEALCTDFGDTALFARAVALEDEILTWQRTNERGLDPSILLGAYKSRTNQNNRYLNFLYQTRFHHSEWARIAELFEARKGDQLRAWLGTVDQTDPQGGSRSKYQQLLGERALLANTGAAEKSIGELARINASIDSLRQALKINSDSDAGTGSSRLLTETLAALDDSTALVNYAWSDDNNGSWLHILGLSKGDHTYEHRKLYPWLDSVLSTHLDLVRTAGPSAFQVTAAMLGDSLLPAFVSSDRYNRIIILPDGPLNDLPFETLALPGSKGSQLLLDHVDLRYEYGMGFIPGDPHRKEIQGMLACAPVFTEGNKPPVANDAQPSLLSAEPALLRGGVSALTENNAEVEALRDRYGAVAYVGSEASESKLTSQLSKYGVLHFATHAVCSDPMPELSGILLAGSLENQNSSTDPTSSDRSDKAGDNILHAYEIRALQLNAGLVVLSACQTGVGKEMRGEGAMSLARAFRFAGASNVVSSLWKVDDRATKDIMLKFYSNLAAGLGKADALAGAKRLYRQENPNAPPSTWAAFILIGDNAPVHLNGPDPIRPWMIGLAVIALLVLTYWWLAARRKRLAA